MTQDEKTTEPAAVNGYEIAPAEAAKIENNFVYHAPFGDQVDRYGRIREGGKAMAHFLCEMCPPSRELSLALTKLEEAVMWANAAIARNETPNARPGLA